MKNFASRGWKSSMLAKGFQRCPTTSCDSATAQYTFLPSKFQEHVHRLLESDAVRLRQKIVALEMREVVRHDP
jgi:hypothetical protein